jgi:hypothetical protein
MVAAIYQFSYIIIIIIIIIIINGGRGSVVGWSTMLQAGRSRVPDPMSSMNFFSYLIPAAPDPGVYSTSNINEYQKERKMLVESRARPTRKTDLSVNCGILNI